jgi:hypothetical protein
MLRMRRKVEKRRETQRGRQDSPGIEGRDLGSIGRLVVPDVRLSEGGEPAHDARDLDCYVSATLLNSIQQEQERDLWAAGI